MSEAFKSLKKKNGDTVFVLSERVSNVGGASKATRLLCEALVEIGKKVWLFSTLPPEADMAERLTALGVKIVVPYINKGWRLGIPQEQIAIQLYMAARRTRPLLIHSVGLTLEARKFLRLPEVAPLYLWECTEALPHVKFLDRKIHAFLKKSVTLLVPSRVIEQNARKTYGYSGPVKLLPFWVEPPEQNRTSVVKRRTGNFLYIGRLDVVDKGFKYLFEAFKEVHARHGHATLTVCGAGPTEPLEHLAENHPAIHVRGYVSEEEYEQVFRDCDAVVLPSLHEGYPLALLEACARSRPIIATRVGSIPYVFGERQCALLVNPRDSQGLAAMMERMLVEDDAAYSARCSDAAKLFDEKSAPQVIHNHLREAYRSNGNGYNA